MTLSLDFMKMTGRKGRVVAKDDGSFVYEPRSKDDVQLEVLNVAEKQRFMEGSKVIILVKVNSLLAIEVFAIICTDCAN